MCSSPSMPATPPPPQDAKEADTYLAKRKAKPAGMGGSNLTGPAGVQPSTLNTGSNTLLGG